MIREFNVADISQINNLLKELNFTINEDTFKKRFLRGLVYQKDTIKGVLIYDFIYDRIEIEYIVVDKACRNIGIASKLLNAMELKHKVSNITLEVRESNEVAIAFYLKNGYKKEAIRKQYYNSENAILMMKKLGE